MSAKYLFNSDGEWIAFRLGDYVYNRDGDWIGWLPWDDEDVVSQDGDYLGTIVRNRLFYLYYKPYRG